jgi:Spy/CpxP family protein refolding chaperone
MNFRKTLLAAGMLAAVAVPFVAHAGLDLTINVGADDQQHYDFKGGARHHHPMIWKAAKQLQNAKHTLWEAADDFHGHKAEAIGAINNALDQLAICEAK